MKIIIKSGYEYLSHCGAIISHLLNRDNIKLYARTERDIDSLIHLTRIYSNYIRMSFRPDKYGRRLSTRQNDHT